MIEPVSWSWGEVRSRESVATSSSTSSSGRSAFRQAMQSALGPWNVSQHAGNRMAERGISLTSSDWLAMEQAAKQAEAKGARDTYMVMGNVGFVVHLPSRTLVTALHPAEHPIVTQIDSVVFVSRLDR
ncbi:hypothetical protein [Alicyclobacillus fructus]|uniref:hypothetical protein n=1 Tax=Alicyclobacillus fructus TaxID=2816082 RepID=UPI001A8EACD9|nr:hypothetical protein [Alicyclobacillus fructus]